MLQKSLPMVSICIVISEYVTKKSVNGFNIGISENVKIFFVDRKTNFFKGQMDRRTYRWTEGHMDGKKDMIKKIFFLQ